MTNKHRGPTLDEFLEEEGILEEVTETALRRVTRTELSICEARLKQLKKEQSDNEDIDFSDIPETDEDFWKDAIVRYPKGSP